MKSDFLSRIGCNLTKGVRRKCKLRYFRRMQNEKEAKTIDFEGETRDEIEAIKSKIGQEVPLSRRYTQARELCW